ncbi:MAG: hypothetical protein JW787_16435, partial [Sedimentisphaerales bacterium]|nr:hypothetical protein [Sedimentisphaerales bacterium]
TRINDPVLIFLAKGASHFKTRPGLFINQYDFRYYDRNPILRFTRRASFQSKKIDTALYSHFTDFNNNL